MKSGLNYIEKNQIRKLADAGHDGHAIAGGTGLPANLVLAFLRSLAPTPAPEPVQEEGALPEPEPVRRAPVRRRTPKVT